MKYIIVKRDRYNLLERVSKRLDNYIIQIRNLNDLIIDQKDRITTLEFRNKKFLGKIGGLQTSLNRQKDKVSELEYKLKLKNRENDDLCRVIIELRNRLTNERNK